MFGKKKDKKHLSSTLSPLGKYIGCASLGMPPPDDTQISSSSSTQASLASLDAAQAAMSQLAGISQSSSGISYSITGNSTAYPYYTTTNYPNWSNAVSGVGYSYSYTDSGKCWPWDDLSTSKQDAEFIKDFKSRHPDFDTFIDEISLVLKLKPGLKNTPLFITLLYDMAKEIRKLIEGFTECEKLEEIVDGKTEEATG